MIKAAKHLGQHFLTDECVIYDLVYSINAAPTDNILEIGAGLGALTLPLLRETKKITAIEFDKRVIAILREKASKIGDLNLIWGDFLEFDLSQKRWRLVGNLPYNLSSPILLRCIEFRKFIIDAHFMLQLEVVKRITADVGTKDYGRLSIALQRFFDAELLFEIPPTAFEPPPKVQSAIVRLLPLADSRWQINDEQLFNEIVKTAFGQRRKMLRQSLKNYFTAKEIEDLGIDSTARAENLSGADYAILANAKK